MKKCICKICGTTHYIKPEELRRNNPDAYCYCRPNTPSLLVDVEWEKEDYSFLAKALGSQTSKKKASASRENGKKGGRPKLQSLKQTKDV